MTKGKISKRAVESMRVGTILWDGKVAEIQNHSEPLIGLDLHGEFANLCCGSESMNREKLNAVFIEHRTQYSADCAFLRDDDHAIRLISPSIATILLCCSFENVHRIIPRGLNFNLPRLVSSQPGGRKGVSRSTFSTYTVVPELWSVDKIDGFWAQISCSTYDAMIPFGVDVSITFLCLAFYRWRLRLSYEKHGYFEVKLGDLNRVTRSRTQPWTQPGYATKRGRYRQNVHKP